ncbi:hypothetical protein ACFQBQ_09910 [Granulicella cerasi]|uniref:Lipoprotein n=1 Tax=Granulicella cerasi TaxID=741063 RepID=A0ABW1Z906_9BACT|nr:hypothetical protein [Granulicella cerasi]
MNSRVLSVLCGSALLSLLLGCQTNNCAACKNESPTPPTQPTQPAPTYPGAVSPAPTTVTPTAGIYLDLDSNSGSTYWLSMPLTSNGVTDMKGIFSTANPLLFNMSSPGNGRFYAQESGTDGTTDYADYVEFGVTAAGQYAPIRRISVPSLPFTSEGVYCADSNGVIAVTGMTATNAAVVDIYAATFNGNGDPTRSITGAATGLIGYAQAVTFDASGNLYVLQHTVAGGSMIEVLVFGPNATGNTAPLRTLTLSLTNVPNFIRVDTAGNIYVGQNTTDGTSYASNQPTVSEFAAGSSGSAPAIATLTLPAGNYLYNFNFDTTGALYALIADPSQNADVLKYAPGATGSAVPVADIVTGNAPVSGDLETGLILVGP